MEKEKKSDCAMCKFVLGFAVIVFLATLVATFFLNFGTTTPGTTATSTTAP